MSLDEKITDVIENLADELQNHGTLSFALEIVVMEKFYRLGLTWLKPGVNGPTLRRLDHQVNRPLGQQMVIDCLAAQIDQMMTQLEKER